MRPQPRSRRSPGAAAVLLAVLFAAVSFLSCAEAPTEEDPFQPVVGNRLLMVSVLDPAADLIWDSVKTVMSVEEGTVEFRPETEEEWTAVRNAAVILAESGNLMMMGRRAMDRRDWFAWCQTLIAASEKAMMAAEARDAEAIFDVGEEIYFACSGCHEQYWRGDFVTPPGDRTDPEPGGGD